MSIKKVKTPAKMFTSNLETLEQIIVRTMDKIDSIVGSSLGPGGRNVIIESELTGIPNKNTKDGVTIFRSLGSEDAYEHLIIEQTRDVAIKTVNEAGDGPQPLYSKVLTPRGFVSMGDIKVGMEICGLNGTTQKVLGVYPKGQKEIYRVSFSDGRVVECCEDHLWSVKTGYGSQKTLTASQMMQDYKKQSKNGYVRYKYYCPITHVEFDENKSEMPLHPYLVGVLLGDGSLSGTGSIELSLGKNKKHILDKIVLPEGLYLSSSYVNHKNYYRVKINGITKQGQTPKDLVSSLGLLGTYSGSKFIPKSYLYASKESRIQLLEGLLDTDGHINKRGRFEFSTVSTELCNDFLDLVRSLGISTHYKLHSRKEDFASYSDKPIHRIVELKGYSNGVKIVNIEPTNEFTEMQCIKVSNADNLYLTDNYIVTHNTTTATVISAAMIKNLFAFCKNNSKYSPQKVTRQIQKILKEELLPSLRDQAIKITPENLELLEKVATISANGDKEMARAVIDAFEQTGYGATSHVTIQELSGPSGYRVELIEGFPISKGYEESIGKFHPAFINDQANQKVILENPLFILFDGNITDLVQIQDVLSNIGDEYVSGKTDFKNVVLVAHKFSDQVLTTLAFNFNNPNTINVVPLQTPMDQIVNSQLNFLLDLSAFTNAKVFDMNNPLADATPDDFGKKMEKIEIYRFRTTVVGEPDEMNIEARAEDIKGNIAQAESALEKVILEERLGKLTGGIARLQIFGASNGELKEKADRAEDAVSAVRAAIKDGCLPGGGRVLINLALKLSEQDDLVIQEVLVPSLFAPFNRLLENAGMNKEEIEKILTKMIEKPAQVYDVENQKFGDPKKMGVLDALPAVEQALINSVSIASVMGTLGGIIAHPRDHQLERQEHKEHSNFQRTVDNAQYLANEANERP